MRTVNPRCGCPIPIGRLGENEATRVVFDVSEYAAFGSGVFSLLHQRSGDQAPYPCVITQNGSTVEWEISSADCAAEGYGKCELIFTAGETIAKSKIFVTVTGSALTAGAEPPEPWEDWVQHVLDAGAEVESFLQTLEGGTPDQVWTKTENGAEWKDPQGGGGGGTSDHRQLSHRNDTDQHTINAVTGLQAALDAKASEEYVDEEVNDLQGQIDALAAASDVVDIVGTHAELLVYDTRDVHDNDIIKVIADETHAGAPSYYRWVISGGTGAWVYVGSESASYTKAEADAMLNQKQDKITEYLKTASVSGNTLNLVKQDDTTLRFTPQGGGEKSWQLIKSAVVPSDPSTDTSGVTWVTNANGIYRFVIDNDSAGNPFAYKKVRLIVKSPSKEAGGCCTGNFKPLLGINIPSPTGNDGWILMPYSNGNQNWTSVIMETRVEDDGLVKTELDGGTNAVFGVLPNYYLDYSSKHFECRSIPSKFELNPPSTINNIVFDCSGVVYQPGTIIELYAEV